MIVENKRSGKRVECETALSHLEKMRGLMFRRKPVSILFDFFQDGIHPIHSFFVSFPFYAIYISSNGEVVDKFRVAPYEAHRQNSFPSRYLLETDEESAAGFKVGDMVVLHAGMENTQ